MRNKDPLCLTPGAERLRVRRTDSERASAVAPMQAKAIAESHRLEPNATVLVEIATY
jgi:hypothetical protein